MLKKIVIVEFASLLTARKLVLWIFGQFQIMKIMQVNLDISQIINFVSSTVCGPEMPFVIHKICLKAWQ